MSPPFLSCPKALSGRVATGSMGTAVGRGVEELELREDWCLDRAVGASRGWPGKHQIGQPQTGGDGRSKKQ